MNGPHMNFDEQNFDKFTAVNKASKRKKVRRKFFNKLASYWPCRHLSNLPEFSLPLYSNTINENVQCEKSFAVH